MRKILITGGAGFIGSNFIDYFLQQYPDNYAIINLDNLTYAGDLDNTVKFQNHPHYRFIEGNICDTNLLEEIFTQYKIDGIIHFAAESHVDNSINNPDLFMHTNVLGTYSLLQCARKFWPIKSNLTDPSLYRFYHISTDEVFGALGSKGSFTEQSPYLPNSPYSASKASSDLIVRSFYQTYNLNIVLSHCSNNFGPHQHQEKLIPTIIRRALAKQSIPIYGEGLQIRDWLYVFDHCRAIDKIFHSNLGYQTFNIGGGNELSNITLAERICKRLDESPLVNQVNHQALIQFVKDRPGHDFRYSVDFSKLSGKLDWRPCLTFEQALDDTIEWYIHRFKMLNAKSQVAI